MYMQSREVSSVNERVTHLRGEAEEEVLHQLQGELLVGEPRGGRAQRVEDVSADHVWDGR